MKLSYLFPLFIIVLFSCQNNELEVDVSEVEIPNLEFKRLDRDLFQLNPQNFDSLSPKLIRQYGPVYQKYLMNPLKVAGSGDSLYKPAVLSFIGDRDIRAAQKEVQRIYGLKEMDKLEEGSREMLKHFRYHFPKRALPKQLIFCLSGWNYAFAYVDSSFILGLDMYMGEKSEFYKMLAYPQYQVRKMTPDYILPDMARGWLLTEFDNSEAENILLNHCIFYGKLFYAIKALTPETPDSLIIGYSSKQMEYCEQYEKNLWSFMAEKNRLYENNLQLVRELTLDGPFTGTISKDCPPRIAMWIGWRIVSSYMKRNEKVSLEQLMLEKDAAKILNKSRYRP